jgi:hypothetical protein
VGQIVQFDRRASLLYVADVSPSVGGSPAPSGVVPKGAAVSLTFAVSIPRIAQTRYVQDFFQTKSFIALRHVVMDRVAPYGALRFSLDAFSDVSALSYAPNSGGAESIAAGDALQVLYKKTRGGSGRSGSSGAALNEHSVLSMDPLHLPPTRKIPDFVSPSFASVYRVCSEGIAVAATLRDNVVFNINGTVSRVVPMGKPSACVYYLCKICDSLLDRRRVSASSAALYCHHCRACREKKLLFRLAVLVEIPAVRAPADGKVTSATTTTIRSKRRGDKQGAPASTAAPAAAAKPDVVCVKLEHVHLQSLCAQSPAWVNEAITALKQSALSGRASQSQSQSQSLSQSQSQETKQGLTGFFSSLLVGKSFKFVCRWVSEADVPSDQVVADIKPSFRLEAL